jgi:FtsH-binding integral membrane protein
MITLMLVFTVLGCIITRSSMSILFFFFTNPWILYISIIGIIVLEIAIFCRMMTVKKTPLNYIVCFLFTLFHTVLLSYIQVRYEPNTVLGAAVATLGMFVALTAYACFTKTDMTLKGGALATLTMMVLMFFILNWLIRSQILHTMIIIVFLILMSAWIVYDTQLIVGGKKRRIQLDLDDWAIGAIIIYSDIVTIFIYILQLFGNN